jgi:hypothetical protein
MGLMSARRLAVVVVVSLCSLVVGLACTSPVAFAEACPNEAARSGPSASLPDCRAYELVTPANKSTIVQDINFENVISEGIVPAVDGNRVAWVTEVEGLGQTPDIFDSFVMFTRTPSGWHTESIAPSELGSSAIGSGYGEQAFTPDLSTVAFMTTDEIEFPTSPNRTIYYGPAGGPYATVAQEPASDSNSAFEGTNTVRDATSTGLFFNSSDHTLAGSPSGASVEEAPDVYRWEGGKLSLVDQYADGSPVSTCGADFRAVSEDGSKVFFTAPGDFTAYGGGSAPSCEEPSRLYMREGNSIVDISAPEAGVVDPTGLHGVEFKGASANGSRVFFTTTSELTKDDEGFHNGQLYEYDTETSRLTRISDAPEDTGVTTAVPSQNGSRIYYLSGGVLYRYNTETKETHSIAAVGNFGDDSNNATEPEDQRDGEALRVTPDGKVAVFFTRNKVSGTFNEPQENDLQVFRYDDESGELTCVSCLPPGAPRDRASEIGGAFFDTPSLYTWDQTPPYTVASDEYVFFESTTQLVPRAVNATGGDIEDAGAKGGGNNTIVADVYEWHNGKVSLISSPNDSFSQHLLGASEDGSNVFFESHQQLVPQDIDNSGDIYDARIDGGFPQAVESAACQGDTCVHPPPALNDPTPGSLSFSGPGNPPVRVLEPKVGSKSKPRRCARGEVRRGQRCVRRGAGRTVRHRPAARRLGHGVVKHDRGGGR